MLVLAELRYRAGGMYDLLTLATLALLVALTASGRVEKHLIGLTVVAVLVVSGAVTLTEFRGAVDWDVLGLIFGMSFFTIYLEESGLAEVIARALVYRVREAILLAIGLIAAAGFVSLFLDNVSTVLFFAPIVYKICSTTGMDYKTVLIGVALSAGMAGSATMIGDPPAIITAGRYKLSFTDFIVYGGRPSMFFLTVIPMTLSILTYTYLHLRGYAGKKVSLGELVFDKAALWRGVDRVFAYETLAFLLLHITLLSIRGMLGLPLTIIVLISCGGLTLTRLLAHRDWNSVKRVGRAGFEWKLPVFLVGVFTLSYAFAKHGLAKTAASSIIEKIGLSSFGLTSFIIWFSVLVSAFLDNTPYIVTMFPVTETIAKITGKDPVIYAWALLTGTTLGGCITYIGSSSNIAAVRVLEKNGVKVTFTGFIKHSLPFNLVNVLSGWLLYTLIWVVL